MTPSKGLVSKLETAGVTVGIVFSLITCAAFILAVVFGWPLAWIVMFVSSFVCVVGYVFASAMNVVRRML